MSVNLAELYSSLNQRVMAGETLPFAEKTFVGFYKAFVDGGRWQLYIDGVLNTLRITAMALILGVILGILVAVVRTGPRPAAPRPQEPRPGSAQHRLPSVHHHHPGHPHDGPSC